MRRADILPAACFFLLLPLAAQAASGIASSAAPVSASADNIGAAAAPVPPKKNPASRPNMAAHDKRAAEMNAHFKAEVKQKIEQNSARHKTASPPTRPGLATAAPAKPVSLKASANSP